ncbi:MAG: UDP-N-acetylglucosamine 1-carboxyvinyltransferase [Firmicutes bacterium]|nr:UDP-N-acetylglucosamine 1-carboxyvinyltransferase [Bacillota bacterium]
MATIKIRGGQRLTGTVRVDSAKNGVLPVIAASLLASTGETVIEDVPVLTDVDHFADLVRSLGARAEHQPNGRLRLCAEQLTTSTAPYELGRKMRASIWIAGALLARTGHFRVPLPGGCNIGERPVDQHIKGFEALGATVVIEHGYVEGYVKGRLKGARVYLDICSVGATINTMLAATLAEGTTIIDNAAKEPEVVDLANYLHTMGAQIWGAGTDTIRIEGVTSLHGADHTVIPDRIEAGTYMIAAAITRGDVFVEGAIFNHLSSLCAKLREAGVEVEDNITGIRVRAKDPLRAVDLKTLPHPGFPTDLQAQMLTFLSTVEGVSIVTETVFENRFLYIPELRRMGVDVKTEGRTAVVEGVAQLSGAEVAATDLRAGAALVLAGLVGDGDTIIRDVDHLDRGYGDLVGKLRSLGAHISRSDDETSALHLVQAN